MEVSDVRRRLRAVMEQARRQAAIRREKSDQAAKDYDAFLAEHAIPVVRTLSEALVAEGHRFRVSTPGSAARLFNEHAPDDFVELTLDTTGDTPVLMVRSNRGRGRRQVTTERAAHDATKLAELSDADVLEMFLHELEPFLER